MEVTMFSAPPSPPSGTRIEEGNYIYIYIYYIYIYIYILKDTEGLKKIHTVLCFALIYFPKRPQRYTKCLLETLVLPIGQIDNTT